MKLRDIEDILLLAAGVAVAFGVYELVKKLLGLPSLIKKEIEKEIEEHVYNPEWKGFVNPGEERQVNNVSPTSSEEEKRIANEHPPQYGISPDEFYQKVNDKTGWEEERDYCYYIAHHLGFKSAWFGLKGMQPSGGVELFEDAIPTQGGSIIYACYAY